MWGGPWVPNTSRHPKLGGEPPSRGELQGKGCICLESLALGLFFRPWSPRGHPHLGYAPDVYEPLCSYPFIQASVSCNYLLTHHFPRTRPPAF